MVESKKKVTVLDEEEKKDMVSAEEKEKMPTIGDYPDAKIVRCKNCSSDNDGDVWLSWNEMKREADSSGRNLCKCPNCKQTLDPSILTEKNKLNFAALPKEIRPEKFQNL